jgi:hypothetical protein
LLDSSVETGLDVGIFGVFGEHYNKM